jgi:ATP-binding cassette, subfamily B, multidrug efflux pump
MWSQRFMIRLFRFMSPFKLEIAGILLLVFLQSLATLYLPTLMSDIVDTGILNNDINYILKIGAVMLAVAAGGTLCSVAASFLSARTSMAFGQRVRSNIFRRVESFSLHEIDKFGTATLITRTTNDVTQVQMVTLIMMRLMVGAPMMCIGGLIMAISLDRPLTLVLAVSVPVLILFITLIARKSIPLFRLMQIKIDKLSLVLREQLIGIRVIRAFNRIHDERRRFAVANDDLMDNAVRVNRIMAFMMPALMLIMNLTSLAIIWFGAVRINTGDMEVGSLMAFIQYAMQIMFAFLMFSFMFVMVPRGAASAARINGVLDTVPEINDPQEPELADSESGFVEFKDVTFSYPGAEQPALFNISFSAKPGEITAIVGSTGSGKSTLVNLIMRFYDVDSGQVLVDGVDVRRMAQSYLRQKVGFVPQKTVLFSGTIGDNIRYGKPEASESEIQQAVQTAQASDFVQSMDGGMDAVVSQGGTNVSGGQKQRISIARALARSPEIYVFDDSFSALDFKTDARLRAALKKEIGNSTVLIVAQRVASVMDADRIIVLEDGSVAGIGTHRELLVSCEVYREIVSSQLSAEEAA